MDIIEQRLQVLEREIRWSRRVNRILFLAIVAVACFAGAQVSTPDWSKPAAPQQSQAQKQPDSQHGQPAGVGHPYGGDRLRTVEADQFVLLDQHDRTRVRMVVTDGGPSIGMFDEVGKKRLELSQTAMASGLHLLDANESAVVSLQLPHNNSARLEIRSTQGSTLTRADGFTVRDADEQSRLHLALINGNFPVLGISQSGQNGPPSIEMTANEGTRSLKLHDVVGHPLFTVHSADNGSTSLHMSHPDHERSLQISIGPKDLAGPAIAFFAPAREDGRGGLLPHLQLGLNHDHKPYVRIVNSEGRPIFAAPAK